MRVPPAEYLKLDLRAHELLHDVPLYDVSAVDLPGEGSGRTIADVRSLETAAPPSRVAGFLYGLRLFLGRVLGWDRTPMRSEDSLLRRLSDRDRIASEVAPGTRMGAFLLLYQFANEMLLETLNATVHGWICSALVPTAAGYRLYWGIHVLPVSWLTRPYLIAIEPFRRVLYPALLGRIRRAWIREFAGEWRRIDSG
jgi:hypothetical protein